MAISLISGPIFRRFFVGNLLYRVLSRSKWSHSESKNSCNILIVFSEKACPVGWDLHGSNCYYVQTESRVTWHDAVVLCGNLASNLTSIHSSEEQEYHLGKYWSPWNEARETPITKYHFLNPRITAGNKTRIKHFTVVTAPGAWGAVARHPKKSIKKKTACLFCCFLWIWIDLSQTEIIFLDGHTKYSFF